MIDVIVVVVVVVVGGPTGLMLTSELRLRCCLRSALCETLHQPLG